MFGFLDAKSYFMLLNQIVLIANQTIFFCRRRSVALNFTIFLAHLSKIFKSEEYLAREKNKLNLHMEKWEKLIEKLS